MVDTAHTHRKFSITPRKAYDFVETVNTYVNSKVTC